MASNLIVNTYHQIEKAAWNRLVDVSTDTWLYHRSELVDLYESLGHKNLSFGIRENGQLVFICPTFFYIRKVLRNLIPLRMFHGGLGAAGPAFSPGISEKNKLRIWAIASEYLTELAKLHGGLCFDFTHSPLSYSSLPPGRELKNPLAIFGLGHARMHGYDSCLSYPEIDTVIDLQNDDKTIFQNMSKSCRYSISKAEKHNLTFCVNPEGSGESFRQIHHQTYERTGATPVDAGFYTYVEKEILPKGFGDFAFACHPDGNRVACLLAFNYKRRVTYYAGGSLEEYHFCEPNYFLQWQTIKHYKAQNYLYYEVGPYFPYLTENSKLFNIGAFKRKFGGIKMELWRGTMVFNESKYILLFGLLGILNNLSYKIKLWQKGEK